MLLQPEDRGTGLRFVATDAFENAEAILQCIAHEMDMRVVPIDDRAVHPNFIGFFHPLARSPICRFPFHHCLAADRDREKAALVRARLDALRGGGCSPDRTSLCGEKFPSRPQKPGNSSI